MFESNYGIEIMAAGRRDNLRNEIKYCRKTMKRRQNPNLRSGVSGRISLVAADFTGIFGSRTGNE